jgi:hypothetical protein
MVVPDGLRSDALEFYKKTKVNESILFALMDGSDTTEAEMSCLKILHPGAAYKQGSLPPLSDRRTPRRSTNYTEGQTRMTPGSKAPMYWPDGTCEFCEFSPKMPSMGLPTGKRICDYGPPSECGSAHFPRTCSLKRTWLFFCKEKRVRAALESHERVPTGAPPQFTFFDHGFDVNDLA